jgi:hypothetical protein
MKRISIFFLTILLACDGGETRRDGPLVYFDLKSFVGGQIKDLNARQPLVSKTLESGEEREDRQTKEVDWAKELDLFVQADLNKPAYDSSYVIETRSLTTLTYRLKRDEDLPVQFLEVIRDTTTGQPLKIKASMRTKNYLFESERILSMELEAGRLRTYSVEGFQQLRFRDPQPFRIEGRILER